MGRKHKVGRIPQNDRREAQREVRRAHHLPLPGAFGIRRPLNPAATKALLEVMHQLQREDDIPKDVAIRPSLHATLMPQRVFGRQALKGLVVGYNISSLRAELKRNTGNAEDERLQAEICDVNVYKGKIINIGLLSPKMEAERAGIAETMEMVGLRGLRRMKEETVLHATLGESKRGLSPTERRHVEHVVMERIDETFGVEHVLEFEPWQVYPSLDYWQQ